MTSPSFGSLSWNAVFQNSIYVGNNLQNILYGTELVLYFQTVQALMARDKATRKKSDICYLFFSTVMVLLVTVWVATATIFGEEMWLLHKDYPGGPSAYFNNNISDWYIDWGTTAIVTLQLMTDGLMIYRCHIIWNSNRTVVIPIMLWLATFVLGIFVDWSSSSPGGDFFTGLASQLGLSYYIAVVFLNTTLTCMICYRLLRHGMRARKDLGHEYASVYFAVVTIVVESVVPRTLSGIAFLVSFGMGSPTSIAFMCVYFLMMCISPQMLILRLMTGRAWDNDSTGLPISTLRFNPEQTSRSQKFDSNGAGSSGHLQTLSKVYAPQGRENDVSISQA